MPKKLIFNSEQIETVEGYNEILREIKGLLEKATYQAYKAVDNLRVQTYWQIGERIVRAELEHTERADYGEKLLKHLAKDINIAWRNIYNALLFYKTYPILQTVSAKLSWSHYIELITVPNGKERSFYESQIVQNNWSVRELRKQISNNLYSRALKENNLVTTISMPVTPILPERVFKNTYNFDFLKLRNGHSERQIEDGLLANVERLLMEFGPDFSLVGRQRKIVIDREIHAIDLEFYHRGIPCIILVDLKIDKFKSEYAGQMNKYLNYYRENKMYSWEKPPVGLIICEHKGKEEVHYALGCLENNIFVAEYMTKLPSENEIKKSISKRINM